MPTREACRERVYDRDLVCRHTLSGISVKPFDVGFALLRLPLVIKLAGQRAAGGVAAERVQPVAY
jgi:hypothetical protein